MPAGDANPRRGLTAAAALALVTLALAGCVDVRHVGAGERIEPQAGEAVVLTRIRFTHDDREYYPWDPSLVDLLLGSERERHFWLRSLDRRAVSPELYPEPDGSLAIRIRPGDYALVGTDEDPSEQGERTALEVVALLRVPGGQAVVYAGDLVLATRYREGWSAVYRRLGDPTVVTESAAAATARFESSFGPLASALVMSPWCVWHEVPAFTDPDALERARQLLDRGCPDSQ